MTGASVLPILLRRKRALLLSGVAAACIGYGLSRLLPQSYLGEGSVIVENKPSTNGEESSPSAVSNVLTQVDVLQTNGLVRRVVQDLDLVHDENLQPSSRLPKWVAAALTEVSDKIVRLRQGFEGQARPKSEFDKTVDYVRKHLTVGAKENSSVITVQFLGGSPESAARVTNTVMATYLATITDARADQIKKAEQWISDQLEIRRNDVSQAEWRVMEYARTHELSEVQGSHVAAIQLSEDQKQLVLANEDLARKQASLETVMRSGTIGRASEALDSRTIQSYKELEAKINNQLAPLDDIDPRRKKLLDMLTAVRGRMGQEASLIRESLQRDVAVARAKVDALKDSIKTETTLAGNSTVAGATMKQLISDLDGKRQLYIAFFTQAGQARVAAEQAPTAHVLFQATPPERPYHTYGVASVMLGFMAGMIGCASWLVLRGLPKINFTNDIENTLGLPVFGSIPEVKHEKRLALTSPRSSPIPVTETFRALWLEMPPQNGEASTILVTSSIVGEGKTTFATGLARRFADDGFRVLFVEADLQRPRLSALFNLSPFFGFDSVLDGSASLDKAIVNIDGLDCLFAARRIDNPMRELSGPRFLQMLEAVKRRYDYVIFDSPPVLHVADALLLARVCGRIIFLVQAGRLGNEDVREAIDRFSERDRAKIVTLLTRVRRSELNTRDYFSGYHTRLKV